MEDAVGPDVDDRRQRGRLSTPATPSVSVIIPCYNYERRVGCAIESILASSRPADEIIVVDDGSTDGSVAACRRYPDVTVICKANGGMASALNLGIASAIGDVVVLCDADDAVTVDRLAWIERAFADPRVVLAWNRMRMITDTGEPLGVLPGRDLPDGDLAAQIAANGLDVFALTSGVAFRRRALAQFLPIPELEYRTNAEAYILRTLPFVGHVAANQEPLSLYTVHGESASRLLSSNDDAGLTSYFERRVAVADLEHATIAATAQAFGHVADVGRLQANDVEYLRLRLFADLQHCAPGRAALASFRRSLRSSGITRLHAASASMQAAAYALAPRRAARAMYAAHYLPPARHGLAGVTVRAGFVAGRARARAMRLARRERVSTVPAPDVRASPTAPHPPRPHVAYVMTHYPRLAMTFITDEVRAIETGGGRIEPMAMNPPAPSDLASDRAQREHERCLYFKTLGITRLLRHLANVGASHPIRFSRLVGMAVRSARLDPGVTVRRLAHLLYAPAAVAHARAAGVRHLHAHFGQSPATIAWFASAVGNLDEPGRWSWSFTIHGFQDFTDDTLTRLDLKAADASFVVCISDYTRSQLYRVTDPQWWDRFDVIRCGIDLTTFPRRPPRPLRAVPRITIVGRLSPEKGHVVLLAAVAQLRARGIELELEIIGSGPHEAAIRAEAHRLNLDAAVVLHGELQPAEVSAHLADTDIFCLPSFSEGLPISIMEAMAVGVPVISTYIGGIPELAVNGETALTVAAGNAGELAATMQRMITDTELREGMLDRARCAVEERHDLTINAQRLADKFADRR